MTMAPVLQADSITKLPAEARGSVLVCGSHGGLYPGYVAASAGLCAVILNDAGIGRDQAGIASLSYLERLSLPAATISHVSARIGDAADTVERGTISAANAIAQALGVAIGQTCREAAECLRVAPRGELRSPSPLGEARTVQAGDARSIVLIDSASLVQPGDAGQIVVTGSHGGLVGGQAHMALQVDAFAAVFNDAGVGIERAGIGRLAALERRGIAAFCVSHRSARIGDARSSFCDGIVSYANAIAKSRGCPAGQPARDILQGWSLAAG